MNYSATVSTALSRNLASVTTQTVIILLIPYFYFEEPVTYVRFISEDNWGEYATFVAFSLSSFLFMGLFVFSQAKRQGLWYFLLAVATFFVAMEEISWGQRILDISTPEILRQVNFQGEIGFHNIRAISPDSITYLVVSLGFLGYGFILPMLVLYSRRVLRLVENLNLPLPPLHLSPFFIATAYFLYFSKVVAPIAKSSEIGELFMGISMACLSVDCSLRILRFKPMKPSRYKLSGILAVCLLLWIAFAQLVAPPLIESAYQGKSIPFFNEMISGQAEHTFEYYEKSWLRVSWLATGLLTCCGLIVLLMLDLPRWVGVDAPTMVKVFATPAIVTITFSLGLVLSVVTGSEKAFELRLNQFLGGRLLELGHSRQAEAILLFLEEQSSSPSQELLISRGILEIEFGREKEAQAFFEQALELQMDRYAARPDNPKEIEKIATIYSHMEDFESARRYWNRALTVYKKNLEDAVSSLEKTEIYLLRAKVYLSLGMNEAAINEYLAASKAAPTARDRNKIEWGIGRILVDCESGISTNSRVTWKEVEAMGKEQVSPYKFCTR